MILKSKRPYWTLLRPKYWADNAAGSETASRAPKTSRRIIPTSFPLLTRVSEHRSTAARADKTSAPQGETSEPPHLRNPAGPSARREGPRRDAHERPLP